MEQLKADTARLLVPLIVLIAYALGGEVFAQQPSSKVLNGARITAIAEDQSSLAVKELTGSIRIPKELQVHVKSFRNGDTVNIEVTEETKTEQKDGKKVESTTMVLKDLKAAKVVSVDFWKRIWILIISGVAVLLLAIVFLGRNLRMLIVGMDNRYSNSKFQMVGAYAKCSLLSGFFRTAGQRHSDPPAKSRIF
jgi:hypothetical protein